MPEQIRLMASDALSRDPVDVEPTVGARWHDMARDVLSRCGVAMAIGVKDSGKSSLLFWLARLAAERGRAVWLVDADVGQSDVGPPCAIAAAPIPPDFERAVGSHKPRHPLDPHALFFVGSTSPRGHLLAMAIGTAGAVDAARRRGADLVLVNTSGYVGEPAAVALKLAKIDATRPDVLLACGPSAPLRPMLDAYRASRRPHVLEHVGAEGVRIRSTVHRQEARDASWRRYFQGGHRRWIAVASVGMPGPTAARVRSENVRGRVVGLHDPDGICVALGVVTGQRRGALEVLSPLPKRSRVARVDLGEADLSMTGILEP